MARFTRTATIAALAAALVAPLFTAPAASATETAIGCTDGANPSSFPNPSSPRVVDGFFYGRIELRYSSNTCAWGRLTYHKSDLVWVDRANNITEANNGNWTQLGITELTTGHQVFTPGYNDNGKVMRACAELSDFNGLTVYCTGWY
ncbi:hypothetical protein GCM10022243_02600 [Saccharothrix violaceirubra]|uniref:DUF2690 domain-containing protein n=1 Tax=Saccharothrix violaceirubra TaxID=413306 RepID=A0A7W7WWW7_9PSEU|nr:hypothetical protein [Saccharothrix violaceirubra]MBB4966018.1 hypothetical protein [Saccharothrix violaceirubra]